MSDIKPSEQICAADKIAANLKKYFNSPKGKAAQARYAKSEKGRAAQARWLNTPEGQDAARRNASKHYHAVQKPQRDVVKAFREWQEENPNGTPEQFLAEMNDGTGSPD